jgi:hypothetical protein
MFFLSHLDLDGNSSTMLAGPTLSASAHGFAIVTN